MRADDILLSIEKLEVVYHNVSTAIQGVSLKVYENQIVALLGTNGAGKTTTLRAVSGFLGVDDAKITEGSIAFLGEEIHNKPPHLITKRGIVLVPEQDKIFDNLTVEENLQVCVPVSKGKVRKGDQYGLVFKYFPILEKVKGRIGGYLSGGERQMLSLSTALLCNPRLLLVDELSLGLAPFIVEELMGLLRVIRQEEGVTLLLVEQNAFAALEVADYGYVIENGRIVFDGDPERLKGHQDIREFYLGLGGQDSQRSYREVKQYRRTRRWYG
ncbi:MAG: ABC transporter ATP-binding protein [Deltaproteobacteria bacterium]|nr:ABC transporter ATP-binding protein [Deltaproteobacteria bacterium]MBW2138035.1 ABC transporter ATP-binding protein [Deltaproteobacteria bacterium]